MKIIRVPRRLVKIFSVLVTLTQSYFLSFFSVAYVVYKLYNLWACQETLAAFTFES